jgi:hypothetical protein
MFEKVGAAIQYDGRLRWLWSRRGGRDDVSKDRPPPHWKKF